MLTVRHAVVLRRAEVKKAYLQLIDEKRCQLCVALVESAKSDVQEARRKQVRVAWRRLASRVRAVCARVRGSQRGCGVRAGKAAQDERRRASGVVR